MSETSDRTGSRRLAIGLAALAAFILLDIGLFGWLIFRSLSKREIGRVLLETQSDAEGVAEQIVEGAVRQGGDLYRVLATEREVRTYVDSVLAQRELIQKVEILDREGVLVYSSSTDTKIREDGGSGPPILEGGELGPRVERTIEERPFDPLSALGARRADRRARVSAHLASAGASWRGGWTSSAWIWSATRPSSRC